MESGNKIYCISPSCLAFSFSIRGLKTFIQVNDGRLRTAGEASQRSTKEDWAEWMRHFSIQLLKESPSPALRTCARLAQLQVSSNISNIYCCIGVVEFSYLSFICLWVLQPFIGRELFAAGFVSCWAELNETTQKQLVRNLEMAFSSQFIPPEILATLLNLVHLLILMIILTLECD